MQCKNTTLGQQLLTRYDTILAPPYTIPIKKGKKNRLYDYDGNMYRDFYLQNGCVPLGYMPKSLSTQIKNIVSIGFLDGFFTHLHNRTIHAIQTYFQLTDHNIVLFTSDTERQNCIQQIEISEPVTSIWVTSIPDKIPPYFLLNKDIANGASIYGLGFPKNRTIPSHLSMGEISPIVYTSILYTLKKLTCSNYWITLGSIIKKFSTRLSKTEHIHTFGLGIPSTVWKKLNSPFRQAGIFVHPTQSIISMCPETTEHDIKYFFKILDTLLLQK